VTGSRFTNLPADPQDRRIRQTWWLFAGSFFVLGLVLVLKLGADRVRPLDVALFVLLVVVGLAAVLHRGAVGAREAGRRAEAESFARILQGLSRSVSPDAILQAIVEELGSATAADHVVVVRRRPEATLVEATLVSTRPGVPGSTTFLPASDLDEPGPEDDEAAWPRPPVAIPIEPGSGAGMARPLGSAHVPGSAAAPAPAPAPGPGGIRTAGPDRQARESLPVAIALLDPVPAALPGPAPLEPAALPEPDPTMSEPDSTGQAPGASPAAGASQRVTERLAARARSVFGLRHTLAAPLRAEGRVIGAIVLSRRSREPWPESAGRLLAAAASEASAALARAYSFRAAQARATTDALTGLPNRRYFDEFCALLARRRRADDAIGILMIDIDRFKVLNDRHGHAVGDEVLRSVARAVGGAVRDDDVPARFGGEEFVVLLRRPTRTVAVEVGQRVREAVGALDLHGLGVPGVSVSVGVAVAETADQPIAEVIERADRALYRAKRAGRDRVVAA
jgi:diguanylate cyclase (GGDEF)-like protein